MRVVGAIVPLSGVRIWAAAAGALGLSGGAAAQTAHADLGVGAIVTRSCELSSGVGERVAVACPAGTTWSRSVLGDRPAAAGHSSATKSLRQSAPADPPRPDILFVTISF
jgi:hypothetical protein